MGDNIYGFDCATMEILRAQGWENRVGGARRLDRVIARGNVLQFWLGEELCGDISPINLTSRAFDESILSG